jgi:phosphatidylinositol phospholipase C beta
MTVIEFEQFLNEKQRDPRLNEVVHPFVSAHETRELINKFEIDKSFKKKGDFI